MDNVLVTSVSSKAPMLREVYRALKRMGGNSKMIGGDINPDAVGRFFVEDFWEMPKLENLTKEDFVKYCKEKKITAVIPSRDGELSFFAVNKAYFSENDINVMVSDLKTVEACIDKQLFFTICSFSAINAIKTAESPNEFSTERFVVKERFGAGANGVGVNLDKDEAAAFGRKLKNPIFQPYIKGKEASVDIYIDKTGDAKGVVMRTRDVVVNGESQITTTFYDESLEKLAQKFVKAFNFYGHIVLQVITDDKGVHHIVECNPRFGGASTLSVTAGLDSFFWFLKEAFTMSCSGDKFKYDKTKTLRQVRYADDIVMEG